MTRSRQRKKARQRAEAAAAKEAAAIASQSGQGELTVLSNPNEARGDLQLINRSIREQWPITPDVKAKVVKGLSGLVTKGAGADDVGKNAQAIRAASVLVQADRSNIARERGTPSRIPPATSPVTITNNVAVKAEATASSATVQDVLELMQQDSSYLDYLRDRAALKDGSPGIVATLAPAIWPTPMEAVTVEDGAH